MLKTTYLPTLIAAAQSLTKHGEAQLATDLMGIVKDDADQKAAVAASAANRRGTAKGGAPSAHYAIETEPGGIAYHKGAKATCAALAAELASLGATRGCPTQGSLAVSISRNGQWFCLVETDNGTVSVTVRRATPQEDAQLTED